MYDWRTSMASRQPSSNNSQRDNSVAESIREFNRKQKLLWEEEVRKEKEKSKKRLEAEKSVEPALANKPKSGPSAAETSTDINKVEPKTTLKTNLKGASKPSKSKKQELSPAIAKALDQGMQNRLTLQRDLDRWFNLKLDDVRNRVVIPTKSDGTPFLGGYDETATKKDIIKATKKEVDRVYGKEIAQHEYIISGLNQRLSDLASMPVNVSDETGVAKKQLEILQAIDAENERWESSEAYAGIKGIERDIQTSTNPNKLVSQLFADAATQLPEYKIAKLKAHLGDYLNKTKKATVYPSPITSPTTGVSILGLAVLTDVYDETLATKAVRADKRLLDVQEHISRIQKYLALNQAPSKYDALPLFIKDSILKIGSRDLLYDENGDLRPEYNTDMYGLTKSQSNSVASKIGSAYKNAKESTSIEASPSISEKDLSNMIAKAESKRDVYDTAIKSGDLTDEEQEYAKDAYSNLNRAHTALLHAQEHMTLNKEIKESDGAWGGFWAKQNAKNIAMSAVKKLGDPDFLTFGIYGAVDAGLKLALKDKIESGQRLTSAEQDWANALAVENVMHNNYGDYEHVLGWQAGGGALQSFQYMLGFVTGSGIQKVLTAGGKAAMKSASEKYLLANVKNLGKLTFKNKLMANLVKTPGLLKYAGGETVYAAFLANTYGLAGTIRDVENEVLGQIDYTTTTDGNVVATGFKGGKNWAEAIYDVEARNTAENLSESWMGHMFTAPLKYAGRAVGLGKLMDKAAAKMLANRYTSPIYRFLSGSNEFLKAGQYDGIVEEIGEEYAGNLYHHMLGVSEGTKEIVDADGNKRTVKTGFWEEVNPFTEKGQRTFAEIATNILLSSAILGMSGMVSHARASRDYNNAKQILIDQVGKENAAKIEDTILNAHSDDNVLEFVNAFMNKGLTNSRQKEAFTNYFSALKTYQATSIALQDRMERSDNAAYEEAFADAQLKGYSITTAMQKQALTNVLLSLKSVAADNSRYSTEQLDEMLGDGSILDVIQKLQNSGVTDVADQLLALHLVQTKYDAMLQRVQDDIDTEIGRNNRFVQRISADDGKIRTASIHTDEETLNHKSTLEVLNKKLNEAKDAKERKAVEAEIATENLKFALSGSRVYLKTSVNKDGQVLGSEVTGSHRAIISNLEKQLESTTDEEQRKEIQKQIEDHQEFIRSKQALVINKETGDISFVDADKIDSSSIRTIDANQVLHDNNLSTYRRRLAQNDVLSIGYNREGLSISMADNQVATIQGKTADGRVIYSVNDGEIEAIRIADRGVTEEDLVNLWTNSYNQELIALEIQNAANVRRTPKRNLAAEVEATQEVINYLNEVAQKQNEDLSLSHGNAIYFSLKINSSKANTLLTHAKNAKDVRDFIQRLTDAKLLPQARHWKRLIRLLKAVQSGQLDEDLFKAIVAPAEAEKLDKYRLDLLKKLTVTDTGHVSFVRQAEDVADYEYTIEKIRPEQEVSKEKKLKESKPKKRINEHRAARKQRNLERAERQKEHARLRNAKKKGLKAEPKTIPSQTDVQIAVQKSENKAKPSPLEKVKQLVVDTVKNVLRDQTTSYNYFVMVDGVRRMFTRIRKVGDNQVVGSLFTNEERDKTIQKKVDRLTKVWSDTKDVDKLKTAILLESVDERDRDMYHSQLENGVVLEDIETDDLNMYLTYIDENKDDEQAIADVIEGVAHVTTHQPVTPSIVIEYVMDQLLRSYLGGENLIYKDITLDAMNGDKLSKYMSEDAFKAMVAQMEELKQLYTETLSWTLITDPIVMTAEKFDRESNRTIRVACETDIVAVDKLGNYHIIDFRTSYKPFDTFMVKGEHINLFESIPEWNGKRAKESTKDNYTKSLTLYSILAEGSLESSIASIEILPWHMCYSSSRGLVTSINSASNRQRVFNNEGKVVAERPLRIQIVFNRGFAKRFTPYTEEEIATAKKEIDNFFTDPAHELIIDEYFLQGIADVDREAMINRVAEHNRKVLEALNGLDKLNTVDDINDAMLTLNSLLSTKNELELRIWYLMDQNVPENKNRKNKRAILLEFDFGQQEVEAVEYGDKYEEYLLQQLREAFIRKYDKFLNMVSSINNMRLAGNVGLTESEKAYLDLIVSDIIDLIERDRENPVLNLNDDDINQFYRYLDFVEQTLGAVQSKEPQNPIEGIPVVKGSIAKWKYENSVYISELKGSHSVDDPTVKLTDVLNKPDFITRGKFWFTKANDGKLLLNIEYDGVRYTPCRVSTSADSKRNIYKRIINFVNHLKAGVRIIPSKPLTRTFGEINHREANNPNVKQYVKLSEAGLVAEKDGQPGISIYDIEFNGSLNTIGVTYENEITGIVDGKPAQIQVTEVRVQMDQEAADKKYQQLQLTNKASFTPDNPYRLSFGHAIYTYAETGEDRPSAGSFVFMLKLGYEENPEQAAPITLRRANMSEGDAEFIIEALLGLHSGPVKVYDDNGFIPGISVERSYTWEQGFGGNVKIGDDEIGVSILDIVDLLIPTVGGATYEANRKNHAIDKALPVYLDAEGVNSTGYVSLIGNVAGLGEIHKEFNIKTPEGRQAFKEYLVLNIVKSINIDGFAQMRLNEADKGGANSFGLKTPLSLSGSATSLKEFVEKNGSIKFGNSSISFDADDFNGKGKGLTGMGWYLKNGFLETDFESIDTPLIGFLDDTTGVEEYEDNSKTDVQSGNPAEQSTGMGKSLLEARKESVPSLQTFAPSELSQIAKAEEANKRALNSKSDPFDLLGITKIQTEPPVVPIDKEKAEAELRRILGDYGFSIEFRDIAPHWGVVGLCKACSIIISEAAEAGTEYHEALHRIVEILIPEEERLRIYDLYRHTLLKSGRKNLSDAEVAEALADEFMNYMKDRPTKKYNSKILNFFRSTWQFIKDMVKIGNYDLYRLYTEINSGKYANAQTPTPERIKAFNERMESYGGINKLLMGYAYIKNGRNFKHIANSLHYKKLINFIAYSFFHSDTQDIKWDGSNIKHLSIEKDVLTGTKVKGFFDLEDKTLDQRNTFFNRFLYSEDTPVSTKLALLELLERYEEIKPDIAAAVASFATDFKEKKYNESIDQKNGAGLYDTTSEEDMAAGADAVNGHIKASYEFKPFERTTDRTKFFFSAVPKLKYVDENVREVLNELMLPEMYSMEYSYITVVNKCHDCTDINDLLARLDILKYTDPMFGVIAARLKNQIDQMYLGNQEAAALVAQIFTQIKSANHDFVLIKSNKYGEDRYSMNIENTSARYSTQKYLKEWSMQFANGSCPYFVRNEDGSYSLNGVTTKVFSDIVNDISVLVHGIIDGSIVLDSPGKLRRAKEALCKLLNRCGLDFSVEMLDEYLESSEEYKFVDTDIDPKKFVLAELFILFLKNNYNNIDGKHGFLAKIGGLNYKGQLNIDKNGKVNGSIDINKYFMHDKFVRELAAAKYSWHRAHDQMSVFIAGNAKAYAKCENNTIDDRLQEILRDETQQNNLKGCVFNYFVYDNNKVIGSIFLKNVKRKLKFNIHSGFKNHEVGNAGVDYSEISKREDYIAKATILLEGGLLIPTMSDKKTFGYIEGLKAVLDSLFISDRTKDGTKPLSKLAIPDKALELLLEYVELENKSVKLVLESYATLSDHDKIDNFHGVTYKVNGVAKKVGGIERTIIQGARYSTMLGVWEGDEFIEFNKLIDENGNYVDEQACFNLAQEKFFSKTSEEKKELLRDVLMHNLRKELLKLEELGLVESVATGKNVDKLATYRNIGLDEARLEAIYKNLVGNRENQLNIDSKNGYRSQAVCILVGEIMMRHIISMQEFDRCFAGNPAFFKWEYDENGHLVDLTKDKSKRLGGLVSTGTNNCLDIPGVPKEYTCVEVSNEILQSSYTKNLAEKQYEAALRTQYARILIDQYDIKYDGSNPMDLFPIDERIANVYKMSVEQIEKEINKLEDGDVILSTVKAIAKAKSDKFNKVDVADGGAYVSAEMCKNMLKMVGSWNTKIAKAFSILQGEAINPKTKQPYTANDTLEIAHAYNMIMTEVIGAQKYTAYGYRYQNGLAVPYYNKMALFPLFKNMCTGNMAKLYDAVTEQGIDMVLVQSAVKVGSQDCAKIDWKDKSTLDNLISRSYQLRFANLRKQFNTDPKEHNLMSMGTQMTKVIMSVLLPGLNYNVNGEEISATQLRNNIMTAINNLSDAGVKDVQEKFFDESGHLNVEKFSKLLIDELASRGASQEILDAVSTRTQDGTDKKVLNCPLLSMSEMGWIESIINSIINKEVIDINTPGDALFLRSVWGMEGKTLVLSDKDLSYSINNGEPLKMINDTDGSMDCVLSIDYFADILRKLGVEKKSFREQRNALIKAGIIGPNAQGNMIGYRIPTQAISSIHALRCVDVLPTVRHTVILPAEFTTITGSDFDIDKLFICRKYYHVVNGKLTDKYSEKDVKQTNVNNLIDNYLAILKDQRMIDQLHGPIDADTQYLKDIRDFISNEKRRPEVHNFDADMLSYQCSVRDEFINGKFGIGPFALNNNNHILTMLYNVQFRDYTGESLLGYLGHLRLDRATDDFNKSIMSLISGLINAHVDVAKDPYISQLNVNSYTYNLVNMLIRTGFGRTTFYFTTQPIMRMLAQAHINAGGVYMVEEGVSRYKAQKNAVENTLVEYANSNGYSARNFKILLEQFKTHINSTYKDKDYRWFIKELMSPSCTVLPEIAQMGTMDDIVTKLNTTMKVGDERMTIFDIQMLVAIANFEFEQQAQDLADLVKYAKIDTKKQGNSVAEQYLFLKGYGRIFSALTTNPNDTEAFINGAMMARESYIETKTKNATQALRDILSTQVPSATQSFLRLVDYILYEAHTNDRADDETVKSVVNSIEAIVKSKYFFGEDGYCLKFGIDPKSLVYGNNTMYDRLLKLKIKIKTDDAYRDQRDANNGVSNYLLQTLISADTDEKIGAKFIDTLNMINDDAIDENEMRAGWAQLLECSKHPDLQLFARDLVVYAFMTSYDNGSYNLFKYCPLIWKTKSMRYSHDSYVSYCEDVMERFMSGNYEFTAEDINMLFAMNIDNDKLVPVITETIGRREVMMPIRKEKGVASVYAAIVKTNNRGNISYEVSSRFDRDKAPKFFKTPISAEGTNDVQYAYYCLTDWGRIGNVEFPIYSRIEPGVSKFKGGFRIYNPNAGTITSKLEDVELLEKALTQTEKVKKEAIRNATDIDLVDNGELAILYARKYYNEQLLQVNAPLQQNKKDDSEYIMLSGGAEGADSVWGDIAKEHGILEQNHWYHGVRSEGNAPRGNVEISESDYNEGRYKVAEAAKMNWGYQYSTMKDDRLVRNWAQVKYADAIFAVGHIVGKGEKVFPNLKNDTRVAATTVVQGGTGYAVGMAILAGKPVYVFDQERGKWAANIDGQWQWLDETPTLTKSFAGVGTRLINEAGKQAIRDVFEKTFFESKIDSTNSKSQLSEEEDDSLDILKEANNSKEHENC